MNQTNQDLITKVAQSEELTKIALNCMGRRWNILFESSTDLTEDEQAEFDELNEFFPRNGLEVVIDNDGGIHWFKN